MGVEQQFRTTQTPKKYQAALARHGQWLRWVRVLVCPCMTPGTGQADLQCSLCKGRGEIYRNPGPFQLRQEIVNHDNKGRVYTANSPIISGESTVWQGTTSLTLGSQPADGSYIQLATPYPKNYRRLLADYTFTPVVEVTDEDSEVYGTNLLRVIAPRFTEKGRTFEGSLDGVTQVYNDDKNETYTVSSFNKEFIYLSAMGTWEANDVLEVDYTYVQPFDFLLHSLSQKRRYDRAYVIDQADATLVTPYWAEAAPLDLFTALSMELAGYAVVDPTHTDGNDVLRDVFDLSKLLDVIDRSGTEYTTGIGNDVELYERNEIAWNVSKPAVPYTVHFMYHPTFAALTTYDTARTSENKGFVNRFNMMLRDRMTGEVTF